MNTREGGLKGTVMRGVKVLWNVWTWALAIVAFICLGWFPFTTEWWPIGLIFWAVIAAVIAVPIGNRIWPHPKK